MAVALMGLPGRIAGVCAALALLTTAASAQTYGYATLPPGTLNHTTASAIAKVMKEKGGVNMLVQPAAGGNVIMPMVGRGEVEIGSGNIMEPQLYYERFPDLRTIADLKGKRVTMGFSAMRDLDTVARSMLATAGLTEADIKPVLVPNVVR